MSLAIRIRHACADRDVQAQATKVFAANLGAESKEIHLYPELFHELFNEIDKERVFADLERWLDARLAAHFAAAG